MAQEVLSECLTECATAGATCITSCLHDEGWALRESSGLPTWASVVLATALIPLSALFSGLTLGLLSLDLFSLKIFEKAGEPDEQEYARRIIPVRRNGNLLLCTLLLGTTLVNNAISIVLADVTSGVVGLVIATIAILVFGEIIPQAVCTRYGLLIGARSASVVRFFIVLFLPITWPISLLLNAVLGRDIGTVYSQSELKRLIELHVTDPIAQAESGLTVNDHRLLMGALEYKDKRVRDVMTGLEQCFLLERSTRLNFQKMLQIYRSGFTRIPVFEGNPQRVCGILYAKDLILVDPDDEVEVSTVMSFRNHQGCHIFDGVKLDQALQSFLATGNHMLIAHRQPEREAPPLGGSLGGPGTGAPGAVAGAGVGVAYDPAPPRPEECEVTGVITLEDVLEELIKAEIVDETDVWEDVNQRKPRLTTKSTDLDAFMAMFEHKLASQRQLGTQEVQAVCAFLSLNVEEFATLSRNEVALKGLVRHAQLIERDAPAAGDLDVMGSQSPSHSVGSTDFNAVVSPHSWDAASSSQGDPDLQLYQRGAPSTHFTLILQGRVMIHTGAEDFQFELGPWSVMGCQALSSAAYVADFDAVAVAPCRLLRIDRAAYLAALRATQYSVVVGSHTVKAQIRSALAGKEEDGGPPSEGSACSPGVAAFDGVEGSPGEINHAAHSSPPQLRLSPSGAFAGFSAASSAGGGDTASARPWEGHAASEGSGAAVGARPAMPGSAATVATNVPSPLDATSQQGASGQGRTGSPGPAGPAGPSLAAGGRLGLEGRMAAAPQAGVGGAGLRGLPPVTGLPGAWDPPTEYNVGESDPEEGLLAHVSKRSW